MKLCFPVTNNQGLESEVFNHFGSAPLFITVDTESGEVLEVTNRDLHHAHGACSPLKAIGGRQVEAVVVGGIGGGALLGLNRAGVTVYRAQGATIAENIACLAEAKLPVLTAEQVCGGHGHGHGCGHH